MSLQRLARNLSICCLLGAGMLAFTTGASAGLIGYFGCVDGCCKTHCCPVFHHCQEGPPKIKLKWGCSRPVCEPCSLQHFGYYRTCWQAWPYPPDWSHCPVPPPSELAPGFAPVLGVAPGAATGAAGGVLQTPRPVPEK